MKARAAIASAVILVLGLVGSVLAADAEDDKCCFPDETSQRGKQLLGMEMEGIGSATQFQEYTQYSSFPRMKQVFKAVLQIEHEGKELAMDYRILWDYAIGKMYNVGWGTCNITDVEVPEYFKTKCLPSNAQTKSTFTIGFDKMEVTEVHYTVNPSNQHMDVTMYVAKKDGKCMPVAHQIKMTEESNVALKVPTKVVMGGISHTWEESVPDDPELWDVPEVCKQAEEGRKDEL